MAANSSRVWVYKPKTPEEEEAEQYEAYLASLGSEAEANCPPDMPEPTEDDLKPLVSETFKSLVEKTQPKAETPILEVKESEIPANNEITEDVSAFDPVIKGLTYMGGECDGARSIDGKGFSNHDAQFGKEMAKKVSHGGQLTAKEYLRSGKMLQKYHKQLAEIGITKEMLESAIAKYDTSAIIDGWIKTYHFKTRTDSGTIYYYKDGVYVPGEILIEKLAEQDLIGCNNKAVQEAKGTVRRRTYLEPDEFLGDLSVINVKNGLLDLKTGEMHLHSPDVITTVQLPIVYDKNAKCPKIEGFLKQVLNVDDIELIYEIAGWLLWREYHIHRAIMLYGHGRNGKGTLLRLFEAFLGAENCSHVNLQKLVGDRFAPIDLVGKAANIFGDLPQKDLSETDTFKCLTGGDTIRVEAKFMKAFDFKNEAKLMFSANNLPKTTDSSIGFYTRWIIIIFSNQFGTPERPLNPNLDAELQTPEELSGFLNKALEGLSRLRSNNWNFSYKLTEEQVKNLYQRLSDPVFAFMEDCCEEAFDSTITKKELHEAYRNYAKANKLKPLPIKRFGKAVLEQSYIPIQECWIPKTDGTYSKGWQGIKLKGIKEKEPVTEKELESEPEPESKPGPIVNQEDQDQDEEYRKYEEYLREAYPEQYLSKVNSEKVIGG